MWIFRQMLMFIRFALPHASRLNLSAVWQALQLVALALIALFQKLWPTVTEIAEHWVEEALAHGFPSIWERQLRAMFRILAALTILVVWAIILVSVNAVADYTYHALRY